MKRTPEVEALLEQIQAEQNPARRAKLMAELNARSRAARAAAPAPAANTMAARPAPPAGPPSGNRYDNGIAAIINPRITNAKREDREEELRYRAPQEKACGGKVKSYARGGAVRGDGCITKGKTRGSMR